jgi:hypothetical protein
MDWTELDDGRVHWWNFVNTDRARWKQLIAQLSSDGSASYRWQVSLLHCHSIYTNTAP